MLLPTGVGWEGQSRLGCTVVELKEMQILRRTGQEYCHRMKCDVLVGCEKWCS